MNGFAVRTKPAFNPYTFYKTIKVSKDISMPP